MAEPPSDWKILVAIDFGTALSGYAFSFSGSPGINMNVNWTNRSFSSYKNPTSVLTKINQDGEHEFQAFGFDAEEKYAELLRGDEADKTCLFSNFKLVLHEESKHEFTVTEKRLKHKVDAVIIFTMALKFVKDHFFKRIAKEGRTYNENSSIKWVLTIPAIWSVTAKSFMRKAAKEAGMIDTNNSDRLVLALEPEVAAIHCRSLKMNAFSGDKKRKDLQMTPNTTYMIVDAGGGTVDIAVHQILDDEAVEEMCIANGGPWGGNTINQALVDLLGNYWGCDFMTKLQQVQQPIWLLMMREFENAKRTSNINKKASLDLFSISKCILQFYKEETGKEITSIKDKNFYINEDYQLVISKAIVDQLFERTVKHTVDTIKNLISEKLTKLDYMFLVGGFISCPYLTDAIKEAFKDKITILIPDDPQLAVLKGAIQFGKNPNVIKKRIMPRTYGYCASDLCPYKRYFLMKKYVRRNMFRKLVTVEQHVDVDEEIEVKGVPVTSDQTTLLFEIYETAEENVVYIDHKSVKNTHASLTVPLPESEDGRDRSVVVYVRFGASEIRLRARCSDNAFFGKWYDAIVEYTPKNLETVTI